MSVFSKLSHAQIICGAVFSVSFFQSLYVFKEETKHYAIIERLMAGRRVDKMDERRQLDYSASERFLYRPAFDVRKIGLCKDKDVQVVDRPKNAVFKPIKWNGTV
ncbi:uncharacterized protein LOC142335070 [Convolutriloba macropyga]|uniref:uncharacterized protein LOC142335070 n=1 Tax=Convolutriloba macropyga TaxID=536237 RepID=UPI003F527ADE